MRVLHVVRTLGTGGGMELNLYKVVVALQERGIDSAIALLNDDPDIIDFGDHAQVHRVVAAEKDRRIIWHLRQLIDRLRPDVIHARNWAAWPDTALARLLCRPPPPLIFSFHGLETSHVPLKKRLGFRAMAALSSHIFTVSEAARDFVQKEYGYRGAMDVIHNGVDTDKFQPRPRRKSSGRLVIGGMGRLYYSNIKNFPLLIASAAKLVPQGLDLEVRIAGHGPDVVALRALAEQLGIPDRVRFVGHVSDVPAFLSELDLFVLSSNNEAMPNALLEAMAMGCACVSTAVGGAVEILSGGDYGLMVPPADETHMAEAIKTVLRDESLRARLGQNARQRVLDVFSTRLMFERYEALYRGLASGVA